jgi:hypothetical protein
MKKFVLTVAFLFATSAAFAQDAVPTDDPYAKFQGIWHGVIYDEDKVLFVFIDDILICNLDGYVSCIRYKIEGQNIVAISGRELLVSGWGETINIPNSTDTSGHIQYVFSGEKLVLVFDGEPIILSNDCFDFPEWR